MSGTMITVLTLAAFSYTPCLMVTILTTPLWFLVACSTQAGLAPGLIWTSPPITVSRIARETLGSAAATPRLLPRPS